MALSDFTIIRRSVTARLFSTVTTTITVAVAVGLMLVLLAMRDSAQRSFERGTGNAHLLISRDSSPLVSVLNAIFYADPPPNLIEWRAYGDIARSFAYDFAIPIAQGDSYRGFPVTATTREFFTHFSPDPEYMPPVEPDAPPRVGWELAAGEFIGDPFDVVIGAAVARESGLRLGDTVHITHGADEGGHLHDEFSWTVVGVLAPTGSAHDRALFTDLRSAWIVHAHDRRQLESEEAIETTEADLMEEDRKITGVLLRVAARPGRRTPAALQQVHDMFRRDPTLTVAAPADEVQALFRIVGNIDQILLGIAAVVMVSSGIAIMLALYNSMEQRRRQIAVLRVLGCSRPRIFGLVMTESALLGLAGAAAGIALAIVAGQVVAVVFAERTGLVIQPALRLAFLLPVVAGTVLLACAAGVIPSILAYRTPVAKNLRPIG